MSEVVIQLLGSLTVTGPYNEDLTPKGGKVGALLALLAVAKGRRCTRAWLQDKLWSDRGHLQGQDSLRHAISDLKRCLGRYSTILLVQGRDLSINRDAVLVDLYDSLPPAILTLNPGTEFLEGIDVRDREFETWLRQMRITLTENPAKKPDHDENPVIQSGFQIALLPVESFGHGQSAQLISAEVLNRIGTSLSNLGPFAIYDYSNTASLPSAQYFGPDVSLLTRCVDYGDCLNLTMSLRRTLDNKVIWSAMQVIPHGKERAQTVSTLVIQVTDQIAKVLHKPGVLGPADRHQAARFALSGIDKLFSLNPSSLLEADTAFSRAIELEDKGVYHAWWAYSTVIRCGELSEENSKALRELATEHAEKALAINKNNPLTLALLTQVYALVFRDYHRAHALIEPAIAMNSDSLMALDSLALLNFYTGNMERAKDAANRAMDAAVYNPYRFGFATTLCMIDTVTGNFDSAIAHGERALAMQPPGSASQYSPTLRYLSAAYQQAGEDQQAINTYRQLKIQEPNLNAEAMDPDEYPVPNTEAQKILKQSFSQIEAALTEDTPQRESDKYIN